MSTLRLIAQLSILIALFGIMPQAVHAKSDGKSDSEIAQILIKQSIARYSGACPCPYNRARNGSKCGKRSAYSKPSGAAPLCYRSDVTPEMIRRYRDS